MKAQCVHSETGLCESCFKYEAEIARLNAKLQELEKYEGSPSITSFSPPRG